jgi:nucleotidyltransferase substrate binding protein (TIGR01987 family)
VERLQQRLKVADQALITLKEVLAIGNPSKIERDASIQRFECTFEAVWKVTKQYLLDVEGLDIGSPKGVIRSSLAVALLNEEEATLALEMVDDRNQTVHTYNEALAEKIYSRIPGYAELMGKWLERIKQRIEGHDSPTTTNTPPKP